MISKTLWTIVLTLFTICHTEADLAISTNAEVTEDGIHITLKKQFYLTCKLTNASGSDDVGVEWFFNNKLVIADKRIHFHNNNGTLDVTNAQEIDCGMYMCQVNDSNVDLNKTVLVQSKPFVLASFVLPSQNKIEGEVLRINCTAEGVPKPQIYWLKDGVNVTELNDTRYTVEGGNKTLSFLNVVDLEEGDQANYSCVAASSTGEVSASIYIYVKDKLAALWPFLGIVVEVTILCVIIFIYEKRRAKQEEEESDTEQNPETKNMNEKENVRQRK